MKKDDRLSYQISIKVPNFRSSIIYNASARHERHKCKTNVTRDCDTSATRTTRMRHEWANFILITTRVKTYFHIPIFTIWQVKDYKEWNNFILSTTLGNASFPCQNAFEKCTTKTGLYNVKSYIKKLYTTLMLRIPWYVPA